MKDISEKIIFHALFAGASFSCMLALGQLAIRNKRHSNFIAMALWLCVGILLFDVCAEMTAAHHDAVWFPDAYEPALNFFIGPLLWFYFRSLIEPSFKLTRRTLCHFIPGAVFFPVNVLLWLASSHNPGLPVSAGATAMYLLYVFSYLSILVYMSLCLKMGISSRRAPASNSRRIVFFTLALIFELYAATVLMLIGAATDGATLFQAAGLLTVQVILSIFILGHRYPDFMHIFARELSRGRYERSKIRGLETGPVIRRLEEMMEIERIFEDEDLSLASLSRSLGITAHQLSEILNEKLGKNFREFINGYRVRAAMRMLEENAEMSVLALAYAVGFKSKSAFNALFRKETGFTPSSFRDRHTSQKKSS